MPTDSYPLHPDQAQPYYTTIPVEEYDRLNNRIAELERMDTEHTLQIAKMNGYIHHLEEELDASKRKEKESRELADPYTIYCESSAEMLRKALGEYRWRKCSEELPTENDYYLVTNGGFVDFEYGCYNEQDEEWQWDHNGKWQYWMPMPNPPKEDT